MDGYALARRIRAEEVGGPRRLPIIALSASALTEDVQRCSDAGMDDFLAKPMTLHELDRMLARHLGLGAPATAITTAPMLADPMTFLTESLGSADDALRLLQELLSTCRDDMREFDVALASGDTPRQHKLLHRMKGALALLRELPPANSDDSEVFPLDHQRDDLQRRLDRLAGLLHRPGTGAAEAVDGRG